MTVVIDASFAVDLVLNQLVETPVNLTTVDICVPAHFEIECAAALTHMVRCGHHDLETAMSLLAEIRSLDYEVEHDLDGLMPGAMRLAATNVVLYDALYIVLATERLAHVFTTDAKLQDADPRIVVFDRAS